MVRWLVLKINDDDTYEINTIRTKISNSTIEFKYIHMLGIEKMLFDDLKQGILIRYVNSV